MAVSIQVMSTHGRPCRTTYDFPRIDKPLLHQILQLTDFPKTNNNPDFQADVSLYRGDLTVEIMD